MIQLIAASVDVSSVSVQNLMINSGSGNSMSDKLSHPYDISMNHSSSLTSSASTSLFSSSSSLYESSPDDLTVSSSSSSTASPPLLYSTSKDLFSSDVEKMNISVLIEQKLQTMANPRAIDESSLIALLIAYTILILLGVTGNGLVCAAVIRKPSMRTGRNVYIINLAISDLLLCIFTMPFTLVDIALKYWPLGKFRYFLPCDKFFLQRLFAFQSTPHIMTLRVQFDSFFLILSFRSLSSYKTHLIARHRKNVISF